MGVLHSLVRLVPRIVHKDVQALRVLMDVLLQFALLAAQQFVESKERLIFL